MYIFNNKYCQLQERRHQPLFYFFFCKTNFFFIAKIDFVESNKKKQTVIIVQSVYIVEKENNKNNDQFSIHLKQPQVLQSPIPNPHPLNLLMFYVKYINQSTNHLERDCTNDACLHTPRHTHTHTHTHGNHFNKNLHSKSNKNRVYLQVL